MLRVTAFLYRAVGAAALALVIADAVAQTDAGIPPSDLRYDCNYVVKADGLWWMRCTLRPPAQTSPPADSAQPQSWDVPLYAMPFSDADSAYLVRAILCRGQHCSVHLQQAASVLR